jgi:NACalpha-BTF3-like transcription factor
LFVLPWTYYSAGELLFGTLLLYLFRVFERHWGTPKFAAYAFLSSITSLLVHLGLFIIFKPLPFSQLRPGPYGLIFALLWRYIVEIPAISKFTIFGASLSDKIFVYLLATQFLLTNPPSTVTAGVSGLLGGMMASSRLLRLHKFRFPSFIENFAREYILPMLQANTRPYTVTPVLNANLAALHAQNQDSQMPSSLLGPSASNMMGNFGFGALRAARAQSQNQRHHQVAQQMQMQQQMQQQMQGRASEAQSSAQQAAPVSDDDVARLVELGFDQERAEAALRANNNDVEMAAAWLFGS